ncbi:hypothetical protein MC69_008615 [Aeromonas hydrophila]|nr:hypothetical protein MC69_008615 [Aeromonas hydrophila]
MIRAYCRGKRDNDDERSRTLAAMAASIGLQRVLTTASLHEKSRPGGRLATVNRRFSGRWRWLPPVRFGSGRTAGRTWRARRAHFATCR